jgi:hypothetical protein
VIEIAEDPASDELTVYLIRIHKSEKARLSELRLKMAAELR